MEWLKKILEEKGLEVEEGLMDEVKKEIPKHFIPKNVYNEKAAKVKELEGELDTTKKEFQETIDKLPTLEEKGDLEKKLQDIKTDFEDFKSKAEERVLNVKKRQAVERGLREAEANPDAIDLLLDRFDYEKLEIGEEGNIKDWENHLNPIKESKKSLFSETKITGNETEKGDNPEQNTYADMYKKAIESGNTKEAIKIKQRAYKEGEKI